MLAALLWAATAVAEPSLENRAPDGMVDLSTVDGLRVQARYASADNFTGAPLPGYGSAGAWLLAPAAEALAAVQRDLEAEGLGLLVYDAYRPVRASLAMVAWTEATDQTHLIDQGYIARRSGHNHGHTVDLTLVKLSTGEPLDMGTAWDAFSEASHTARATGPALANRLRLKRAMEAHGFQPYSKEWWHFRLPLQGTAARDVPYACFEPPEGAWTAPTTPGGWTPHQVDPPQHSLGFKFKCLCINHAFHIPPGKVWYRVVELSMDRAFAGENMQIKHALVGLDAARAAEFQLPGGHDEH